MAARGRLFDFHGAFKTKEAAARKESRTPGAFVRRVVYRGRRSKARGGKRGASQVRYLVVTGREP